MRETQETQNQDSIPMTTHISTPSTPSSETKKTQRVKLTRPDPERTPRQANGFIKNSKDHNLSRNGNEGEEGVKGGGAIATSAPPPPPSCVQVQEEISGRERLKRHRVEVAGRVWIPDVWGQEDYLKDWIDCTVFDSSLGNNTILSARAALVDERRTANSGILRIENRC